MTFASSSEVSDFMVTGFFGHISGLRSHAEPFYQSSALVTWLPWLARSAGLSVVGTCLHWICGYCLTFCARLETNCRYWPFPTIQWRATVLSSQPSIMGTGSSFSAFLMLMTKLIAMWALINSNLGTVSSLLANLAFAATRVWLIPSSWFTTEYTAAPTP